MECPRGVLSERDLARVRDLRPALIRLLSDACPCPPCTPAGGLRIQCATGLDRDPEWAALRVALDALDDRDERAAIQAEGCTAAELEALRRTSSAAPQRERWINPDLDAEDLALLRACERLDIPITTSAAMHSAGGRPTPTTKEERCAARP